MWSPTRLERVCFSSPILRETFFRQYAWSGSCERAFRRVFNMRCGLRVHSHRTISRSCLVEGLILRSSLSPLTNPRPEPENAFRQLPCETYIPFSPLSSGVHCGVPFSSPAACSRRQQRDLAGESQCAQSRRLGAYYPIHRLRTNV
jgi:hypothetical protein